MVTPGVVPDPRPLTDRERLLLGELLRHGTRAAAPYAGQLPQVTVVSRCSCGCPTLDLAVAGRSASPGSPSTTLAGAAGVSPEGVLFEIILHGREGIISELEVYAPAGADGPFTLPGIERIEFFGEPRTETHEL
jgi:hypothetical protein